MYKKIIFSPVIIMAASFCVISNLFVPNLFVPNLFVPNLFAMETVTKAVQKWPKVELHCHVGKDEINAVARIEPGLFVKSVAINLNKNLKTGKLTRVTYVRSVSGLLRSTEEKLYPDIVAALEQKIEFFEKALLRREKKLKSDVEITLN